MDLALRVQRDPLLHHRRRLPQPVLVGARPVVDGPLLQPVELVEGPVDGEVRDEVEEVVVVLGGGALLLLEDRVRAGEAAAGRTARRRRRAVGR